MAARASYQDDPALADRVFDLLDRVFPGVRHARANGEAFGATWESVSTPFVASDGDRIVGHVGLLPLPLVLAGHPAPVGGVHGVAVDPERRRSGIFRRLIEELLATARQRTLVLTTLHPEYFTPFGFRVVPEAIFRAAVTPRSGPGRARRLDLGEPGDRALMKRLLSTRAPISTVLGVGPELACWAFYEYRSPIRYLADLETAVIAETRVPGSLSVYDVIGPAIPPLEALLDGLGGDLREVVCYFAPDRLGGPFVAEPHDLRGGPAALEPGEAGWVLMVRGPFPVEGAPLMLPRPARC